MGAVRVHLGAMDKIIKWLLVKILVPKRYLNSWLKKMDGYSPSHANNSIWLVVSIPLKNMKVSWDDYS